MESGIGLVSKKPKTKMIAHKERQRSMREAQPFSLGARSCRQTEQNVTQNIPLRMRRQSEKQPQTAHEEHQTVPR